MVKEVAMTTKQCRHCSGNIQRVPRSRRYVHQETGTEFAARCRNPYCNTLNNEVAVVCRCCGGTDIRPIHQVRCPSRRIITLIGRVTIQEEEER